MQNPTNFKGVYPPFTLDPNTGGILVMPTNFAPGNSSLLNVSNSGGSGSQSVTFTKLNPVLVATTFQISNTGTHTAYLAFGSGSATAVPSTNQTPAANCYAVAAGAIFTIDAYLPTGTSGSVDTIAAICSGSNTTTLEITIGYGQ